MVIQAIHDQAEIRRYLARVNLLDYIYQCGNLESPFWEQTQWYGLYDKNQLQALAVFVIKYDLPVLLASSYCADDPYQNQLLAGIHHLFPNQLYCHLNPRSAHLFPGKIVGSSCSFKNMKLADLSKVQGIETDHVQQLGPDDQEEMMAFLQVSHPDYLLDQEFFDAGYFWGIKMDGQLVSLAGVTAITTEYSIVSIGNVATHPDYRQQGLATQTMAKLILQLQQEYENIVLNVKAENRSAIQCYEKLGFVDLGIFEEVIFE